MFTILPAKAVVRPRVTTPEGSDARPLDEVIAEAVEACPAGVDFTSESPMSTQL